MSEHIYTQPGATFNTYANGAPTGLVGTIGYRIYDALTDTPAGPRVTAGITEHPAGSSLYKAVAVAPATSGAYVIVWDTGGVAPVYARDYLTVNHTGAPVVIDTDNDGIVTLAELRTQEPLDNDERYPDDIVLEVRDALIEALEHECMTAFVRRTRTEHFSDIRVMQNVAITRGTGRTHKPGPAITAVNIGGTDIDEDFLPDFIVGAGGLVNRRYGSFGLGCNVTYEYGWPECPGRVKRAVRIGTAAWLAQELDSPIPDRATSWTSDGNTFRLVTAGVGRAVFDLPELNAVARMYAE